MRKLSILFVIFFTILCTALPNNAKITRRVQAKTAVAHHGIYTATYYGDRYKTTRHTANGDVFDKNAMTCAAPKKYKFGTMLEVTNVSNGKSVIVKVTDRGGFGNNVIDLTHGAFGKIAKHSTGRIKVNVKVVS